MLHGIPLNVAKYG